MDRVGIVIVWCMLSLMLVSCVQTPPNYASMREDLLAKSARDAYEAPPAIPAELSLAEAKTLALRQNPNLHAIQARIEGADARRRKSYASYYPRITAGANAQHTHRSPSAQVFGGTTFTSQSEAYETYSADLNATWMLFDGLQREYNILVAKYGVEALEASRKDAQRLLAQSISQMFFAALLAQKRMEIAKADQVFNQKYVEETQKRLDQGTAPRADVLNFQIRLDNARIAYLNSQNDYRLSCILLAELMGYPEAKIAASSTLIEPQIETSADAVPSEQEALSAALAERPDIAKMMAEIQANHAMVNAIRGSYMPEFSIYGTYGYGNPEFRFDQYDQNLAWGARMDWELFGGFATQYSVEETRAEGKAISRDLQRQWQSIISEIRQERQNLASSRERLSLQQGIYDSTQMIREDVEKSYTAGQVTLTRLNEAQRDLRVADENLAVIRIELMLSRENLAAAIGDNTED